MKVPCELRLASVAKSSVCTSGCDMNLDIFSNTCCIHPSSNIDNRLLSTEAMLARHADESTWMRIEAGKAFIIWRISLVPSFCPIFLASVSIRVKIRSSLMQVISCCLNASIASAFCRHAEKDSSVNDTVANPKMWDTIASPTSRSWLNADSCSRSEFIS